MIRTLFIWALVLVVPLTNLRMVCVDHRPDGAAKGASASECDELCPREAAPADLNADPGCVLVAGGCSAISSVLVGIPVPLVRGLPDPNRAVRTAKRVVSAYRSISPAPFSPPPKA